MSTQTSWKALKKKPHHIAVFLNDTHFTESNIFARTQVPRSRATNDAYLLVDVQDGSEETHGSEETAHHLTQYQRDDVAPLPKYLPTPNQEQQNLEFFHSYLSNGIIYSKAVMFCLLDTEAAETVDGAVGVLLMIQGNHCFQWEIDEEIRMDEKVPQVMAPPRTGLDQTLEKMFLECAGQDQQVGSMELQVLLNRTMNTLSQLKLGDFSVQDCLKIIQCFSDSGTGRLTLHEFKQAWTKMEEWEGIFVKYDQDKSGTMNTHEMRLALNAAGFHLNKQTTEVLLKKYSNPWLQIDFGSFMSFMVHLEYVFWLCKSRDVNGDGVISMSEKEWMELSTACCDSTRETPAIPSGPHTETART